MLAFECKFYTFAKPNAIAMALAKAKLNNTALKNVSNTFAGNQTALEGATVHNGTMVNGTKSAFQMKMVFTCETKSQPAAEAFCSQLGGRLPMFEIDSELKMATEIIREHFDATGKHIWTGRVDDWPRCVSLNWGDKDTEPSFGNHQACSDAHQFICLVNEIPLDLQADMADCNCDNKTSTLVNSLLIQYASSYFVGNILKYCYNILLAPIYFLCLGSCCYGIRKALDWAVMEDWAKSDSTGSPAIMHMHKDMYFTVFICYDEPDNLCCFKPAELASRASQSLSFRREPAVVT